MVESFYIIQISYLGICWFQKRLWYYNIFFSKIILCKLFIFVDLTGPNLSQDSNSPIFANTVLTIVCTALSAENQVYLSWTCVNGTREDDILVTSSTTTFISKLTYEVKITDNGRICTCNAQIGSFSSTDTITLDVRTGQYQDLNIAFYLLYYRICRISDSVYT